MRKVIALGTMAGVLVALAGVGPAFAGDNKDNRGHGGYHDRGPATLSVFHGVPGLIVDVYVDGVLTVDDFEPGTFAGPLDLAAGTYSVAITPADAAGADEAVIGPVDLSLTSGTSYTAAAHLTADGAPTATLFTNNTDAVGKREGRLTVRHIAAAPAVDVLANGAAAFTNLTNPNEGELTLPVGTISAAVAAAGTTDPLLGPADVNIEKRTNTIVYAWGSLQADNLALAVQSDPLDKKKHHGKRW